jgi:type II secretory ATPase GspE/PulE/Tfp pilus assembly ATPase PilB-like protein
VNRHVRDLISRGASQTEILKSAMKLGYRPLRYDGLKKALMGLTSLEQVERQTLVEFL